MAFYSLAFIGFVLICIIFHAILGKIAPQKQWIIRLLASCAFYIYVAEIRFIFLLISTLLLFIASRLKNFRKNRFAMFLLVGLNLAILIVTKYILPITNHPILLPLGISFYTLMAISYLVDIYGGKYEPEKNYFKLLLYLSWFPQLIEGPISRFDSASATLYLPNKLTAVQFRYSFYLFLFGAIKKYAIGDLLAPMVNASLGSADANLRAGSFLLFGAILFAIEQYANFSGGIDMALAISSLFGVKLDNNFNQPYFATTLADFWRRWHITLGSFMRDYVFYPYALTRPVKKFTKKINLFFTAKKDKQLGKHMSRAITGGIGNLLVFALVGLWHGPELHYLAWGLYNGVIIALSDLLAPCFAMIKSKLHVKPDSKDFYVFQIVRTFTIIVFAGYFDVIVSVHTALACFKKTFLHFNLLQGLAEIQGLFSDNTVSIQMIITALCAAILLFTVSLIKEKGNDLLKVIPSKHFALRWVICYLCLFLLLYSFAVSKGAGDLMYAAF